jgi:hypothetical protein
MARRAARAATQPEAGRRPASQAIEPRGGESQRFWCAKVEKWFRRNCQDVLQRECSAQEKGDFIAWLSQVK